MSLVSSFAGQSLLHQGGGFEPLRKTNFSAIFYGVGGNDIILAMRKIQTPGPSVARKGMKFFNETMHYAGSVTPFEIATLAFNEYVDRSVATQLWAWFKMVWDPNTGGIGMAAAYKKRGEVMLLDPAGGETQSKWTLEGCFPTKLKLDELSHEGDGEIVLINMEVSVDRAMPT